MSCMKFDLGDKVQIINHSDNYARGAIGYVDGFFHEIKCYSIRFTTPLKIVYINENPNGHKHVLIKNEYTFAKNKEDVIMIIKDTYADDSQLLLISKSKYIKEWNEESL